MFHGFRKLPHDEKKIDLRKERNQAKKNRCKRKKIREAKHLLKSNGYLVILSGKYGLTEVELK